MYSGTLSQEKSAREIANRAVARKAAAESIVLLQNDGILPLKAGARVALFGSGAMHTIKGGTGSGDVNERDVVSVYQGLKKAGFMIANEPWLRDYDNAYQDEKENWRQTILKAGEEAGDPRALIHAYVHTKFEVPIGRPMTQQEIESANTDTAIYILSRNAGEGVDRRTVEGDYYLTVQEREKLAEVNRTFPRLILVLNCGGPVDLGFMDGLRLSALIQLSQPGMEGGNALADIVSGAVTPCGKMTDTWARRYEDYPNAAAFSHRSGDLSKELYADGIYVGYRYFDTFGVEPRIPFGFGLSYTAFALKTKRFMLGAAESGDLCVTVQVEVTNTGSRYAGREVVQVYASCPQGRLKKEYQRLCAFGKTPLLAPGESCMLALSFPVYQLASFSEDDSAYVLEAGDYLIAIGNSSASNDVVGILKLDETAVIFRVAHVCPLRQPLREIEPETVPCKPCKDVPVVRLHAMDIPTGTVGYRNSSADLPDDDAGEFVETLSGSQLLSLTSGDPGKGQGASDTFGSSGFSVPGAAGETHNCASNAPWNLAGIVLADGPAGLRLAQSYQVTKDGKIIKPGFIDSIEHGIFGQKEEIADGTRYYQYCTAFPVGTMLAQSWDTALLYEIGRAVAVEMAEFGVTLWLAPGMNIHRNPLCGRNYEYYSEDPLLTGMMAAAITQGVQSGKGIGTTIKHFACNNLEDNRKHSDSIVSERALREIYLHGFEIAVKHAQPMALMTSYNLINGVHTANSYDLVTKVLRDEWGFQGLVMTDWTTTGEGGSSPVGCMKAGNDLIMPGSLEDLRLLREALDGTGPEELEWKDINRCVANLVRIVWQSREYEGCSSYAAKFSDMRPLFKSHIL